MYVTFGLEDTDRFDQERLKTLIRLENIIMVDLHKKDIVNSTDLR